MTTAFCGRLIASKRGRRGVKRVEESGGVLCGGGSGERGGLRKVVGWGGYLVPVGIFRTESHCLQKHETRI